MKKFYTLLMMLALVGCKEGQTEAKQNLSNVGNCEMAYIDVGGHIFEIQRSNINSIRQGGSTGHVGCNTTKENTKIAEELVFLNIAKIQGYEDKPYKTQYFIETLPTTRRDQYKFIKEQLKEEGKTIQELPKRGSFYKYVYSEKHGFAHYISDGELQDIDGNPIVLSGCGPEHTILECSLSFKWKPNLWVHIRLITYPSSKVVKPDSIDAWNSVFPYYLRILRNHLISHQ